MSKKKARPRYGRRAAGQTQTSISLSEEVFYAAKQEAARRSITLSALIEETLQRPAASKRGGKT